MAEAYPETKYRISTQETTDEDNRWMYNFFDVFVEDGILWSEDYGFSRRWRALGGEIWMDPQIGLNHVGQHVFEGKPQQIYRQLPSARSAPQPEGAHHGREERRQARGQG
jgi:hypothetical protein